MSFRFAAPVEVTVTAGEQLKRLRDWAHMSLRQVEDAAAKLASKHGNPEFEIPASRLSDIETKGMLPNLYRLYALAVIYRVEIRELLTYFGIQTGKFFEDISIRSPEGTHTIPATPISAELRMPTGMDGTFNPSITTNIGRLIYRWGWVPLQLLQDFENRDFAYGYIGTEDLTMHPLLVPGCFVQIDTSVTSIDPGPWRSELERPIYFLEGREDYICAWCSADDGKISVQPHPLSPTKPRTFRHPDDIEIVGKVIGVAMRLDARVAPLQSPRAFAGHIRSGITPVK